MQQGDPRDRLLAIASLAHDTGTLGLPGPEGRP